MNNLSNDPSNRRKKISPKMLVAVASLSALLAVSAVAAPTLVGMSKGTIDYFNLPQQMRFLSKQAEYHKYNAEVGITVEIGRASCRERVL